MVISFMRVLQVNAVNAIRSTGRNCGEMSYYIKVMTEGALRLIPTDRIRRIHIEFLPYSNVKSMRFCRV